MTVCKTIPGYHTYSADIWGAIHSHADGRDTVVLKPRLDGRGYLCVDLVNGHKHKRTHKVHRLVALTFLGPTPQGFHVDHIDGCPTNNRLENLRFRLAGDNSANGRKTARAGSRPLAADQREAVGILHSLGWSTRRIAAALGVGDSTIRRIKKSL